MQNKIGERAEEIVTDVVTTLNQKKPWKKGDMHRVDVPYSITGMEVEYVKSEVYRQCLDWEGKFISGEIPYVNFTFNPGTHFF